MPDASCLVPGAADNADADAVKVVKYVKLSKQCSWWTFAFEVHMWASWGSYFVKHERPELNNHLKRCQIPQITQQGWDMNTSNNYVKKLHDYQGVRARSYIRGWRNPGLIWKCSCSYRENMHLEKRPDFSLYVLCDQASSSQCPGGSRETVAESGESWCSQTSRRLQRGWSNFDTVLVEFIGNWIKTGSRDISESD